MIKSSPIPKPVPLIVHTTIHVHETGKLPSMRWMLINGKRAA